MRQGKVSLHTSRLHEECVACFALDVYVYVSVHTGKEHSSTHMHALSPRHQSGPITHAYLLDLHAYLSRYIYMNDSVLKIHKTSVLF